MKKRSFTGFMVLSRTSILIAFVTMFVPLLAGCGGGGGNNNDDTDFTQLPTIERVFTVRSGGADVARVTVQQNVLSGSATGNATRVLVTNISGKRYQTLKLYLRFHTSSGPSTPIDYEGTVNADGFDNGNTATIGPIDTGGPRIDNISIEVVPITLQFRGESEQRLATTGAYTGGAGYRDASGGTIRGGDLRGAVSTDGLVDIAFTNFPQNGETSRLTGTVSTTGALTGVLTLPSGETATTVSGAMQLVGGRLQFDASFATPVRDQVRITSDAPAF